MGPLIETQRLAQYGMQAVQAGRFEQHRIGRLMIGLCRTGRDQRGEQNGFGSPGRAVGAVPG
jgi:hypothetical protein